MREYWLLHPTDRIVTVYRLENREFGKPDIFDMSALTAVGILPGVAVVWEDLLKRLPPVE